MLPILINIPKPTQLEKSTVMFFPSIIKSAHEESKGGSNTFTVLSRL